jgi:hypothetical protein
MAPGEAAPPCRPSPAIWDLALRREEPIMITPEAVQEVLETAHEREH